MHAGCGEGGRGGGFGLEVWVQGRWVGWRGAEARGEGLRWLRQKLIKTLHKGSKNNNNNNVERRAESR